ncbi:uroporphyrinogen-III C-methyltransferase [Psittacicella gerlachiana]|uniref:Uncharacterized protein n=1 Tax=Psittacicella gerlachiana TaxID=2028574 RepID=A0A3A1YIQ0_9GAMM|nr:uroporphyrinogen-III C-methyltransferase [Psittacicella gerlachiana]RIY37545.1 hypothetical protein CKF59_01535 [Psittacicella gerlachiana]
MIPQNNANFPTDPEKRPLSEQKASEQAEMHDQQEQEHNNSKHSEKRTQQPNPNDPIFVEPPKYRFLGLMVVLALGLSGFAVYKMYEPSIFNAQDLEATSAKYVSVADFNTFKNSTQQDIEILKIKYNILQQQFDSRFNQTPTTFDRTFGGTSGSSSTSTNFNASNLNRILDNYVTIENLNATIADFNTNIQSQLSTLGNRVTTLEQRSNALSASGANSVNNASGTSETSNARTNNANAAQAGLTTEQVQALITQVTNSESFKTYVGTLIAEYVLQHPTFSEADKAQLTSEIAKNVATQVLEQVNTNLNNQINTAVEKSTQDLTKQINAQLPTAIANSVKQQTEQNQNANLQRLYAHVNYVITQQILHQVQAEINRNGNLDSILMNLRVAYSLAPDEKLRAAVQADYNNLADGRQANAMSTLVNGLLAQINNVSKLPLLNPQDLQKATQKIENTDDSAFTKATKDFFSKFIQVQKVGDGNGLDLPTTNVNLYLQENLKLNLQNALVAASVNNTQGYKESLESALKVLTTVYPQDNQIVQDLISQVQALSTQTLGYNANYQLGSLSLFNSSATETGKQ